MNLLPLLLAGIVLAGPSAPEISVKPRTSLLDEPVHISVVRLAPRTRATVTLTAVDARGRRWQSFAVFRTSARGTLNLDRAAPISGSYDGRWGMGLFSSLTTATPATGAFFRWSSGHAQPFTLRVRAGGRTGATRFRRGVPAVAERQFSVARDGFYGRYYKPANRETGAAVVLFGGSEGGLSFRLPALALAARGHPALAIAYFKAPGLPQTLSNIPLEYFAGALTWLRRQPEVGQRRIIVVGASRGSEAAQLLGVYYPHFVGAVVASVPSNVALCSFPGCSGPAWTFGGQPVPYTRQFNNPAPSDNPEAVIPDERIAGPVLAVCGGRDAAWISCFYSRAIMDRLAAAHRPDRDRLYSYPRASHGVGALLPFEPVAPRQLYFNPVDARARQDVWPKVLRFLTAPG